MVHHRTGEGRKVFMTTIAGTRCRNVDCRFTDHVQVGPGMARGTLTASDRNTGQSMVECRICKPTRSSRYVARFTGRSGWKMIRRFGDHRHPIERAARCMARRTSRPTHGTVVHCPTSEGLCRRRQEMAASTGGQRRRNVIGWFADRRLPIMTTCSRTRGSRRDRDVSRQRSGKGREGGVFMTTIAGTRCRNVDGRFTDHVQVGPGMAQGTLTASDRYTGRRMVEIRICESTGRGRYVARFTGRSGWKMIRRFGNDSTDPMQPGPMATGTTSGNAIVIHRSSRSE